MEVDVSTISTHGTRGSGFSANSTEENAASEEIWSIVSSTESDEQREREAEDEEPFLYQWGVEGSTGVAGFQGPHYPRNCLKHRRTRSTAGYDKSSNGRSIYGRGKTHASITVVR